jgi:hypothetical protein
MVFRSRHGEVCCGIAAQYVLLIFSSFFISPDGGLFAGVGKPDLQISQRTNGDKQGHKSCLLIFVLKKFIKTRLAPLFLFWVHRSVI